MFQWCLSFAILSSNIFIYFSFGFFNSIFLYFFFSIHKGDWGILFWKILAKCLSKKDKDHFCLAWNYSNSPWWTSIIWSLRFARSSFFFLFFSGVFWFKFYSFLLAHSLLWRYFSLSLIWKFLHIHNMYQQLTYKDWYWDFCKLQTPILFTFFF